MVALVLLCVIGFGLRTWDIDWDRGQHQHPDERYWSFVTDEISAPTSVSQYFDSAGSPLNPYNHFDTWVYGTAPLFATKAVASWLADDGVAARAVTSTLDRLGVDLRADGEPRFDDGFDANLVGRLISALFDTGTIVLVFLLGSTLAGRGVGLIAAALATFTVLHIQYSHFYGAETVATFFATAVVLGAIRMTRGARWPTHAWTGLALGLAAASKLNAAAIAVAPAIALLVAHRRSLAAIVGRRSTAEDRADLTRLIGASLVLVASAAITFRIAQPYAFDGLASLDPRFTADLDYLQGVNDGSASVPWTIQWIGRVRLLAPLSSAFWWGMGPGLGLAVVIGTVVAVVAVRRRRVGWLVPMGVIAVYLVLVSLQFNALIRYLLPAYPTAIVVAAVGVAWLWGRSREVGSPRWWRMLTGGVAVACVAGTAFWGLAFANGVYGREHPRVTASEWLVEQLPPGASISHQIWDDALPLRLPGEGRPDLVRVDLDPFRMDSPDKIRQLVADLDRTDYVVEASNRIYDAVVRFPARFPRTVAYYDALFDGSLGFEQVAEFRTEPSLFGISIDDRGAEETFTVYDHPTVTVWARTDAWSPENALAILDPDRAATALDTSHDRAGANALQLRPAAYASQQGGGTFDEVFDADGWASTPAWLWWFLWIQVAGLAAVPWVTALFARLPGQGYGLSKLLGLMAVVVPTWVTVAWGVVDMSGALAWAWWAAAVAVGIAVGVWRRDALAEAYARHRRSWLAVEATFLGVFAVVLAMRLANPDLWHPFTGGEKPMELAYLTAIARSTELPAFDPWFAGGYINYYYLGWFFVAVPIRALQLVPEVAFNLAVPTFAALGASVVFAVGHGLAGLATGSTGGQRGRLGAGAGAVLLVLGVGNLDAAGQQLDRLRAADTWGLADGVPAIGWVLGLVGGAWQWITGGDIGRYDWWAPSRVNDGTFDITEFPFWSLLFGDLHPHVMGLPFLALTVALALAYIASADEPRRGAAIAALAGLVTGLVRMVHTWDLPTALIIVTAAVVAGQVLAPKGRRAASAVGHLAIVGATHIAITWPYVRNGEVFDAGIDAAPVTTRLVDLISQFGVFFVVLGIYLASRLRHLRAEGRLEPDRVAQIEIVVAVGAGVAFGLGFSPVAGLSAGLAVVFAAVARREQVVAHAVASGLAGLGLAIAGGVDVVTIDNDVQRLNTVFKFWYQSWLLLALVSAFAAWHLVVSVRSASAGSNSRRALGAVAVVLLAAGLAFPLFGSWERFDARFQATGPTLDGLAYLATDPVYTTADQTTRLADDWPLAEWLRRNVEGSPTIVEAVGPSYQWAGRMSVLTGLPSVIGWEFHQVQQRRGYATAVIGRRNDVTAFYTVPDPDAARRFLRTYDVAFVVVGTQEHALGRDEALVMLDTLPELTGVFRSGRHAIFEVDQAALAAAYTRDP